VAFYAVPVGTYAEILEGKCSTLLPRLHLRQIGLFLWRKGIELLLVNDNPEHEALLHHFWDFNNIHHYFDDIWTRGAKTGEILLYVKPVGDTFKIRYFDKNQFDYVMDDEGLVEVSLKCPRKENPDLVLSRKKLGKLKNPWGFVPCVLIQNRPTQAGRGLGEFEDFASQLERHDWMIEQIRGNLEYFGGPIFYSSRSRSELLEAGLIDETRSIAAQGGYGQLPAMAERVRVKRIIAGLESGEQIGFATPDAVSSEVVDWIDDYEAQLRVSMGSIPDTSQAYSAGDADILSRYAVSIATAERKAQLYITNGIQAAFEMMFTMLGEVVPLRWRWKGSIFPDSASTQLTKSIVGRNLLRLGVNLEQTLHHIFPELSELEIQEFLEGGFAYELLSGVAGVAAMFPTDPEGRPSPIQTGLNNYIQEALRDYARSRNNHDPERDSTKSGDCDCTE
jgi:hypothetical protein